MVIPQKPKMPFLYSYFVSHPPLCEETLSRRQRIASWVRRRGVELGEIVNFSRSAVFAWASVDIWQGKVVAPLTAQTLNQNGGFWFWALILNTIVVSTALVLGLVSGNNYRVRSYVSLLSSLMWSGVAITALGADIPPSIAAQYVLTFFISFLTAVILWQKAAYARKRVLLETD